MNDPAYNIRAAFRYVTLGLMEWHPPELTPREYRRLELVPDPALRLPDADKQTHYGHAGYVDPYDVAADWEETA